MLKPNKRTGMSDAHMRPDLKAQNPLYARVGTSRSAFEYERCHLNARVLADQNKTEAQRRHEAMVRGERHIIVPASFEAFIAQRKPTKIKHEEPRPALKPSWAVRRANRFQNIQPHSQHKENTMSEGPPGNSRGQSETEHPQGTENQRENARVPDIKISRRGLSLNTWVSENERGLYSKSTIDKRIPDGDGGWRSTHVLSEDDLHMLGSFAQRTLMRKAELEQERAQHREHNPIEHDEQHWHDDEMTHDEIKRESFKKSRSSNGKRRSKPRDRSAR